MCDEKCECKDGDEDNLDWSCEKQIVSVNIRKGGKIYTLSTEDTEYLPDVKEFFNHVFSLMGFNYLEVGCKED